MFKELIIGEEIYKLRLDTKTGIELEKRLGRNPISMLMDIEAGVVPRLSEVLIMLQVMLQSLNHGFTMDKTMSLFDKYVEDGNNMFDLIPVFIEVFQNAGYLSKEDPEEAEGVEKN